MKKREEAYHTMQDENETKNEEFINEPSFTCIKSTIPEEKFKEFMKLVEQALELTVYISFRHIFRKYFNIDGEIPNWLNPDNCWCEFFQRLFRNHKFDKIIELLKQDIKIFIEEQLRTTQTQAPPNTPEKNSIELRKIKHIPDKDKFLVIDSYLSQS